MDSEFGRRKEEGFNKYHRCIRDQTSHETAERERGGQYIERCNAGILKCQAITDVVVCTYLITLCPFPLLDC